MVTTRHARRASWRARAGQFAAALGVLAAGYVSLGTSCDEGTVSVRAERELAFLETETFHRVRIRVAPPIWRELVVSSNPPLDLARVADQGGLAGAASTAIPASPYDTRLTLECGAQAGCDEILVLVRRTERVGAFTAALTAELLAPGTCEGDPPEVAELRLDVED